MKNKLTILFETLVTLCTTVSCTLEETVISTATRDTFYRNVAECQAGLNGCYNPLRSIYASTAFFQMTEVATDLMLLNVSSQYNAICNITPTRPGIGVGVWQYGYQGVMRANAVYAAVERAVERGGITEEESWPLLAEAVVLRAFFYYIITSTFGDTPFYTEEVTEDNRARIARLPRMSASDTRNYLIDELMSWLMPAGRGGREALKLCRTYDDGTDSRIGAAVGLMLAGKFCMWEKRWDDAIAVYGVLEDIYGHYAGNAAAFAARYPLTDIPFSRKYVDESILELSNIYEEYGLQTAGGLACWCSPQRNSTDIEASEGGEIDEANIQKISDIYNGIAIPELGGYARTYTSIRPTSYYFQNLMRYASPDLRSGEYSNGAGEARGSSGNLAWRWAGYAAADTDRNERSVLWFSTTGRSGNNRPWLGNKFWCFSMYNTRDFNNYKIFRMAGVLLNLAEAHLMKGDPETACTYLNITRGRAGLDAIKPAVVGGNDEALLEEIRQECARELFGEYQRKFDLVRWGIWYERTLEYNDGSYLRDNIRPCHRYWPIPAEQVTYSGGALDNDEYGE